MTFTAQLLRGVRATLVLWTLTVVVITLPLLGLAHLVAPDAAAGSLIRREDQVLGSRLIGQAFRSDRYLQGRPAGSPNLAPSNPALKDRVAAAASAWQKQGIDRPAADLLQDSGSGVDPHISLQAARQQLPRLARERQLPVAQLEALLRRSQEGPLSLQAIEPVVNVLAFNLALDQLTAAAPAPRQTGTSRP
jgi:K+-transporting ATPase ATPase C chain